MNDAYLKLKRILGENRVEFNEPLFKFSSFKIGGKADLFFRAKECGEIIKALKSARELGIRVFILSGGTNLLISDSGFRGLVIKNETGEIKIAGILGRKMTGSSGADPPMETVFVEADSGVQMNRLVRYTLDQGLAGIEMFLGQPGTVGGAVYINAHNVNQKSFFGDRIEYGKIITGDNTLKKVDNNYFHFGYDNCVIQDTGDIVLGVGLKLYKGDKDKLWEKAHEALEYRQKSQPNNVFTSGCTFRNISLSDAMRISTPDYTCSAGYLIDSVGLKGASYGGAKFSEHHANFIINYNHAKATDVLKLINTAKRKIKDKYHVDLREEIVMLGEF